MKKYLSSGTESWPLRTTPDIVKTRFLIYRETEFYVKLIWQNDINMLQKTKT